MTAIGSADAQQAPPDTPPPGFEQATTQEQAQYETFMGATGTILNDRAVYPQLVKASDGGDPREAIGNAVAQASVRAADQVGKPDFSVIFAGILDTAAEAMEIIDEEREAAGKPPIFNNAEAVQGVVMRSADMARAALMEAGFIDKAEMEAAWNDIQQLGEAGQLEQAFEAPAMFGDRSAAPAGKAPEPTRQQRRRAVRRARKKARQKQDSGTYPEAME
ncbi:MAG: hypothetical protein AAGD08_16005 [Pseudomonadota bacterium]